MRDKNTPMNLLNGRGEKERPRTTASGLMSFRVLEKRNNECTSHTCECGLGLSLPLPLVFLLLPTELARERNEAGWQGWPGPFCAAWAPDGRTTT